MNYMLLNNSIVLNYDGKTLSVANTDKRYEAVLQAIREERLADIPALVEIERTFQGDMQLVDGIVQIEGTPLPVELSDRLIRLTEFKLPTAPLVAFWKNLRSNPSYNSRQALFKFLEHNGHPLTQDGCFVAYRGVSEDFKDKHTQTFNNAPGSICEMARELVDDNPNNTCSAGLHVACYDYAKEFGSKLVEVKVNPADVVTVPTDYNGTKMRVCKFEVVRECEAIRTEEIYGLPTPAPTVVNDYLAEENDCPECGEELDGDYCPSCDTTDNFND